LRNISEDIHQCRRVFNISEENVVYKVSKDDQIIEKLIYLFKNADKEDIELEEMDDSNETRQCERVYKVNRKD
ncbi:4093_t:CDS:2, partial [Rhizophagus irregularis]